MLRAPTVPLFRERYHQREHVVRIEAEVRAAKIPERADHETRGDEEDHRQRDLPYDENASRHAARSRRRQPASSIAQDSEIEAATQQGYQAEDRSSDQGDTEAKGDADGSHVYLGEARQLARREGQQDAQQGGRERHRKHTCRAGEQ